MALRACKECGHKVSTAANSCPNCGAPSPAKGKFSLFGSSGSSGWGSDGGCGCIPLVLIAVAALYFAAQTENPQGSEATQQSNMSTGQSSASTERANPTTSTQNSSSNKSALPDYSPIGYYLGFAPTDTVPGDTFGGGVDDVVDPEPYLANLDSLLTDISELGYPGRLSLNARQGYYSGLVGPFSGWEATKQAQRRLHDSMNLETHGVELVTGLYAQREPEVIAVAGTISSVDVSSVDSGTIATQFPEFEPVLPEPVRSDGGSLLGVDGEGETLSIEEFREKFIAFAIDAGYPGPIGNLYIEQVSRTITITFRVFKWDYYWAQDGCAMLTALGQNMDGITSRVKGAWFWSATIEFQAPSMRQGVEVAETGSHMDYVSCREPF